MRKALKIESYDLSLKMERMPQRKQRWNGYMLTAQERMVRRQRCKSCNHLRQCIHEHVDGKCFLLGKRDGMGYLNESLLDRFNQQTP